LAPSRAKVTAVALPLPQPGPTDPAPVISETLFSNRIFSFTPEIHRSDEFIFPNRRALVSFGYAKFIVNTVAAQRHIVIAIGSCLLWNGGEPRPGAG